MILHKKYFFFVSLQLASLEDWYETCVYFVPIQFVNLHKKLYHIYLFKVVNNFPNN